jgi:hypothetical protein
MIRISFGGSGLDRANVRNTATITAPAAKITRPEWARKEHWDRSHDPRPR